MKNTQEEFLFWLNYELNRALDETTTVMVIPKKSQIKVSKDNGEILDFSVSIQIAGPRLPPVIGVVRALADMCVQVWANPDHSNFFLGAGRVIRVCAVTEERGIICTPVPCFAVIWKCGKPVECWNVCESTVVVPLHDETVEILSTLTE